MIFDTIYNFYYTLFYSADGVSTYYAEYFGNYADVISCAGAVITITLGVFALFRILGGVLKLFKV